MRTTTRIYVYDPLCGWCYAAAPPIEEVAAIPGIRLELFGGGRVAETAELAQLADEIGVPAADFAARLDLAPWYGRPASCRAWLEHRLYGADDGRP